MQDTDRLQRRLFGLHAVDWPLVDDDDSIEFHLPHSAWIDLFGDNGLQVERLVELQAPEGATTRFTWASADWARKWPSEEAWILRKLA